MSDLVEFLLARLAEDKAAALAASPGPWHVNAESDEVLAVDSVTVADGFALSGQQLRATTAHIARHDPARVLAEVVAKQEVMQLHSPGGHYQADNPRQYCQTCGSGEPHEYPTDWPCRTLRPLALPYADHADYRDEWRL